MYYLITLFFLSFFITYFLIPLIIKFALNRNIVDYSDHRKKSRYKIVRIGGLGIIFGISFSFISLRFLGVLETYKFHLESLILISICFFILGFLDDIFKLSPWIRLLFQIIFSSLAWYQNLRIDSLDLTSYNFFGDYLILPNLISYLITVAWITGIVNAINWIDGLDALAAGIIIFAILGLILVNLKLENTELLFIIIPILGSCIAFLKYNYLPAKVLMGDGGSYSLGYLVAATSLLSATKKVDSLFTDHAISIFIPIILLLIPIIDMSYVIYLRISKGYSPFFPDRNHLHHRLIDSGVPYKNILIRVYSSSAAIAIFTALVA